MSERLSEQLERLIANVKHGRDGRDGHDGRDGADGQPGDRGERGPIVKHEWRGTALQLEKADGSWGEPIDLKGERGETGKSGKSGADGVNGKDGAPGINGKDSSIPGPPGPAGEPGQIGPMPKHRWDDTELQFEMQPGVWGKKVDLQGPPEGGR